MLFASTSSTTNTPNFLVPNGTIVVELVLFVIVLGIVAKFILPPLQRVMDERDSTIRSALEASDEGHAEAERLDTERAETLARARATARAALEAAAQQAEATRAEARARGQVEHDRILAEAETQIASEGAQARAELAGRLDSVVIAAAERVVGVEVNAERHRAVLDRAIAALSTPLSGAEQS